MDMLLSLTSHILKVHRYLVAATVWEGDSFANSFANLRKSVGLDAPKHLPIVCLLITLDSALKRSQQQTSA